MSKRQEFRDFVINHEFDQFAKDEEGRAIFRLWRDEYESIQAAMDQLSTYATPQRFPDCDTCGSPMDYMPWHYATETERHLHACNDCWPKVNPAKNMNRPPVAYAVHMGGGVIELHHAPLPEFAGKPHVAVPLFTEGDTWLDAINMFTASVLFPPGKTEGPGND